MTRLAACLLVLAFLAPSAAAQSDVLIDVERPRQAGGMPVHQRAILVKPAQPTDTALLWFRGNPGYARIASLADKDRNLHFLRSQQQRYAEAGIAIVVMDCPTDQWGDPQAATACKDDYRASAQHADDVRSIMAKLREDHGITRFFVMGHSLGSIGSRWLALNLGREIEGSIHSASINIVTPTGMGGSVWRFPYGKIAARTVHIHHESDRCRTTPYGTVRDYAEGKLMTVRGGTPRGPFCGGQHLHSYGGLDEAVARAVIDWIRAGTVTLVVGN